MSNENAVSVLPKKPSKLIRLAVADMKKSLEQGHSIDMTDWVAYRNADDEVHCFVCMAGAVMIQERVGICAGENYLPQTAFDSLSCDDSKALDFLNEVRAFGDDLYLRYNPKYCCVKLYDSENPKPIEIKAAIHELYAAIPDSYDVDVLSHKLKVAGVLFASVHKTYADVTKGMNIRYAVCPYHINPELFFETVEYMAEDFERVGA